MATTAQLIISFLGSFLGGGIVVGLINWLRTSRSERTTRKHQFFKEQITNLYGPLYFFAGLNEALFALDGKFHQAYKEHFVNQKWSTNPRTTETLEKNMSATLAVINHYAGIVRDNNCKIVDLVRQNYAYIDPQDAEIFQRFIIDHLRLEREFKEGKPLEIPSQIYFKVGEISYSRKEFLELIKNRFIEKNTAIRSVQ